MAGNDWINSYLEAILDSGGPGIADAGGPGNAASKKSLLLRERGRFSPTRYFVEEVITGFDETDLYKSWVRAAATRSPQERNTRLENMCWRIWNLARKKKQIEGEEALRQSKRRLERERGRRDATADMSEDLSEGEKGDVVSDLSAHGHSTKGGLRRISSVDALEAWANQQKDKKLYIVLISIHGLIRGENMELGRDSDTGGQVKYVVELARALGAMPGVYRVDLLTRQISSPDVDWSAAARKSFQIKCVSTAAAEEKSVRVTTVKNGDNSLSICRVLNGMWQTSGGWGRIDRDAAVEAMLGYADAGLTTFDMADHYGPAEDLYGMFINRVRRERPPELLEEVRGLTKWVPPPVKMTSKYVRDNIDISRKRMDVASLDMLQFHWWDYSNPGYIDALKHLTDLKEEGKIKTIGLTNFDTERLHIILENGIPIVSNQVQHSVVDMRPQQKMAELCQLTGVKLITYGTVMGGLLSEKFLDTNLSIPFAGPPLNTPSLQKYKRMVDAWGGWSLFQALLRTLNTVASKHGVPIPAVAVRYILDQKSVAGSMIGVRLGLAEHIEDTNALFTLSLDEEDVDSITEASSKGKDLLKMIGDCGDEYRR